MGMASLLLRVLLAVSLAVLVYGHGRLIDPPSRNSAWRYGFDTPKNWNDMGLNCGGFAIQWNTNNGQCGACGDPYNAKQQQHVYPGKYATGTITRTYKKGQDIQVKVQVTANHMGYFIFHVGKLDTPPITEKKLTHVLQLVGGGTKWTVPQGNKIFTINLKLPGDLTCDQCVFQWWYRTGNNWGCDDHGCGNGHNPQQETFVNCADIRIQGGSLPPSTQAPSAAPPIQTLPPSTAQPAPGTPAPTNPSGVCEAAAEDAETDRWCRAHCAPES